MKVCIALCSKIALLASCGSVYEQFPPHQFIPKVVTKLSDKKLTVRKVLKWQPLLGRLTTKGRSKHGRKEKVEKKWKKWKGDVEKNDWGEI